MSLNRRFASLAICLASVAAARPVGATIFFTDTFSYDNGAITAVSGGNWNNHSGATSELQVTDGKAIVQVGAGSEDVNRALGATLQPAETWYYAARFTINAGEGAIANNLYFLHFKEPATQFFRGRLFLTQPNVAENNFTLGIASSSTAGGSAQPGIKWATDLTFGTEYIAVVSYTADDDDSNPSLTTDGFASLWVNPVNQASTSVTDTNPNVNINTDLVEATKQVTLAIRQAGSGATQPVVNLDVVSAGTTFAEVLVAVQPPAANNADFNSDGVVDGKDFLIWQRNYGATGQPDKSTGDATGGGTVDDADFAVWKAKFGGPPAVAAAGAVPEPASVVGFMLAVAALAAGRRRHGS